MLIFFRGSMMNLLVTFLGEQFLSLRMMPSWETWVSTLAAAGHEFAFHSLQTMSLSPGVSGRSRI